MRGEERRTCTTDEHLRRHRPRPGRFAALQLVQVDLAILALPELEVLKRVPRTGIIRVAPDDAADSACLELEDEEGGCLASDEDAVVLCV